MSARFIVIDHTIDAFLGDRILDPDYAAGFVGGTIFISLANQARERGWKIHTADVFLDKQPAFDKAVCLSNEFTPLLSRLISRGVMPGLLISGESPNVARKFYRELPILSSHFPRACLFRGSLQRLSSSCQGEPFLWPNPARVLESQPCWAARDLLGMVSSYKRAWGVGRQAAKQIIPRIMWKIEQWRDQSLQCTDLYTFRIGLTKKFANHKSFRLYGQGWESALKMDPRVIWTKFANPPTSCSDKLSALGGCRFSLIIENCIYPGYVTEKMFDAFRAGTVPVYMGAPDIEDFVPPECFVDYRLLGSPEALWNHLASMPELRWNQYREAIVALLDSPQYQQHLEENVARQWLVWLENAWR